MSAIQTASVRRPRHRAKRILARFLLLLIALPILLAAVLWLFGPQLIAPAEPFAQGPGGAVAYVTLLNQLQAQSRQREVRLVLREDEFSGMLASALLSGKTQRNPLERVRSSLHAGEIEVDTVLALENVQVFSIPDRFRGPIGLNLRLKPTVSATGEVNMLVTNARLGRLPVPLSWVRWAGKYVGQSIPGFHATEPSIELPIGQMISGQAGTRIHIKDLQIDGSTLTLIVNRT